MRQSSEIPPPAIVMMKMALGLIDATGARNSAVARHLNAAIEIAMSDSAGKPRDTKLDLAEPADAT